MERVDLLVVGAGISGLAFAAQAARAGRRVLVVEEGDRAGGCLDSRVTPEGYWFELGAHTCYNSYTGLIALLDPAALAAHLLPRAPTHLRFLNGQGLARGSNLGALLRQLSWVEAAVHLPRLVGASKAGTSVGAFYGRIVGRENYRRVLGPMLSAVPSQRADDFPADMLFKSRDARRTDLPRSFTFAGGLATAIRLLAETPGVEVRTAHRVETLTASGPRAPIAAHFVNGAAVEARAVCVATRVGVAATLLRPLVPAAATALDAVGEAHVDSVGVVLPQGRVAWPTTMFAVPRDDVLHSVVTRDSVADPAWRSFTGHFKPGLTRDARLARLCEVLDVRAAELRHVSERHSVLPSPVVGHAQTVRAVDAALAGQPVAVVGNYFDGLSIEDCVQRAGREWTRIQEAG